MSAHPHTTDLSVPAAHVRTLAVLGDSIGVGVGDPVPGGGWRGFPPLLADALGAELVNLSRNGARLGCLRTEQLPMATRARPDAAVVFAGMNDSLRSDFEIERLRADLDAVVSTLTGSGVVVVTVRYHDHGRVFRLPGPLRRALTNRIRDLNAIVDDVSARHGTGVVDLDALPGTYAPATWSVDRLHPSEYGHRMFARALAEALASAGFVVPAEVSLECGGSATISRLDRWAWLVAKGIPWLWRRGSDLVPYA
ncbi:MAG TPA: SGNH/GDSL hydrolase family protein, partial [Pseudonocardiaceae bacterium]|nr:SGNH/GDSL hydrolase family protein [Pseudonocardiaceae bacterium]